MRRSRLCIAQIRPPNISARIEIPAQQINPKISPKHSGGRFQQQLENTVGNPPENSIEQPARRRDARACRGEARRGGNEPLVLEGDEGEGLGLHLPRRRPPSAAPTLPPHHPTRLPGRLRPVAWRPRRIPRRRPVALAYGWQKRRAAKRTGVGVRTGEWSAILA